MIGYEDGVIYASKKYLNMMNKTKAMDYINNKKYNSFKINNPNIYRALKN